jgi:alkylresorcinol/alkylpyrone synthase
MNIAAAAGVLPAHRYSQPQLIEAFSAYWEGFPEQQAFLERVHARTGVNFRHLAFPIERYPEIETWGEANNLWIEAALDLGERALTCALQRAAIAPETIDALFVVSVTGVASPSVDARLIDRMGLSHNLKRIPIFGLGCVAGAAGLSRAADYVKAYPKGVAALLAIEICSLTLQKDDLSTANLIASGLFADGAAAVIVTGEEVGAAGPSILATRSVFYTATEDVMGWDISEKGFRIILSPEVPEVVERHLAADVDSFLTDNELTRQDIGAWILHTGGPKLLQVSARTLGLSDDDLAPSWECLARMGNLSSASVLFVLEEYMLNRRPAPGTLSVLAAMGPGFCSELLLLRW